MKTVELRGTDGLKSLVLVDRPEPRPGPREALIRIRAASLNYRDVLIPKGRYPAATKQGGPIVPLSDGAGEVIAVGPEVSRVRVGDRVSVNCLPLWIAGPVRPSYTAAGVGINQDGMLRELACFDEQALVILLDYLSFSEAAALPCASVTAWHALVAGEPIWPGQTMLALGSGGVSLLGLQIAKMFGAKAILTTGSPQKVERLKAWGADAVVNTASDPDWERAVLDLTNGQGVDCVIEVGGAATISKSVACTRPGGRISVVGFLAGFEGGLDPITVLARQLWVYGVSIGNRAHFEALLEAMAAHHMHPAIDAEFPFEHFVDAYRHLEGGSHLGKVVVCLN